jgi:hypothetical protein
VLPRVLCNTAPLATSAAALATPTVAVAAGIFRLSVENLPDSDIAHRVLQYVSYRKVCPVYVAFLYQVTW